MMSVARETTVDDRVIIFCSLLDVTLEEVQYRVNIIETCGKTVEITSVSYVDSKSGYTSCMYLLY